LTSVRFRILLLLTVFSLAFIAGLTCWQMLEHRHLEQLSRQSAKEQGDYVTRIADLKSATLTALAEDYTIWDDMCAFAQKPNRTWGVVNLDEGIGTFDTDSCWVFDTRMRQVYGCDPTSHKLLKCPVSADALLLLGIEHDYYANVESILVYPNDYVAVEHIAGPGMTVSEVLSQRAGESWSRGPIVLSWSSALAGGRNALDGRNVVLHEFAHKLDLRDGSVDGTPPLRTTNDYTEWSAVMNAEFMRLRAESAHGRTTLVDDYGATNTAEFFAVVTECFFEQSRELKRQHPSLYAVLQEYYGQDPAARGKG